MHTQAHLPFLLFAAPVAAQGLPTSHYGDSEGGDFAKVVELIGDVNADGNRDVAVGAPYSDETIDLGFPLFVENTGSVSVYSGSTGEFLRKKQGPITSGTEFGQAICDAGDGDGDGIDDVLVGSPAANGFAPGSGKVQLLSGVDGTLMQTYFGSQTDERYGSALCAGHMDPDMTSAEAAIGAPYHDDDSAGGWAQEGRVEIVELLTGDVLKELQSGSTFDITHIDYIDVVVDPDVGVDSAHGPAVEIEIIQEDPGAPAGYASQGLAITLGS